MTKTLSPLTISKNQNASDDHYRDTTPIKIDPQKVLFCNIKCSLDVSHLNSINTLQCNMTTNNTKLPYISLNFGSGSDSDSDSDKNKLYVLYNNDEYHLKYILIVNGTIHTPPITTATESIEIVLRLMKANSTPGDNDDNLCLSVFADISDRLTIGSEFFSQIFDLFKKDKNFTSKYIKNHQKEPNKDHLFDINVDNNWSPSMIIPSNKTFYKYKGTFPFNTPGDPSLKKCNWIIFSEPITIHDDTYDVMQRMLTSSTTNDAYRLNSLNHTIPTNPVYKYIDSKYREKLEPEDLVVKCEKNGECGAGEIENNDKDELNDRLNKCPLTLSSKEVETIYSSYLDDILPTSANLTLIILAIVFNALAIIGGYFIATLMLKRVSVATNPFINPSMIFIGLLKGAKWIKEKSGTGVHRVVGSVGLGHVSDEGKNLGEAARRTGKDRAGGDLIDQHTRFVNHYNQIRH
jgi:uncharacterized protein YneF (UPF0154 family)